MAPAITESDKPPLDKGAKRREKSRDAARCRRQQESDTFNQICKEIPVPEKLLAQMDRSAVMRLVISFMKLRGITNAEDKQSDDIKREFRTSLPHGEEYINALNGFITVVSSDCNVLFVSENVKQYIGMTNLDLIGQSLLQYTHEGDHDDINQCWKDVTDGKNVEFFMRMKNTLTDKGKNVNLKSATYKVLRCEGVLHQCLDKSQHYMVVYCEPIPHPTNIEMVLDSSTFLSQHSLDMKFTYCDTDQVGQLLGYTDEDMIGQSLYSFWHTEDVKYLEKSMSKLYRLGQIVTNQYRMLTKFGGYVWVVTQATVITNQRSQQPQNVVCVHYVISDKIYESCSFSLPQLQDAETKVNDILAQSPEEVAELGPQDCTDSIFCDTTDLIFGDIGLDDATEVVLSDNATGNVFLPGAEVMAQNAPSIGDEIENFDLSAFVTDDLRNNAPSIGDPQWNGAPSQQNGGKFTLSGTNVNVDRVKDFVKEKFMNDYGKDTMTSNFYQPPSVKMRNMRHNDSFSPPNSSERSQVAISAPKRKLPSGDFQIIQIPKNQYQQHVLPPKAMNLVHGEPYKVNPPESQDPPVKKYKAMNDPQNCNMPWKYNKVQAGLSSPSDILQSGKYTQGDARTLSSLLLQPGDTCDNMISDSSYLEPCRDRDPSWPYLVKNQNQSLLPVLSVHDCEVNAPVDDVVSTLDWRALSAALNAPVDDGASALDWMTLPAAITG